VYFFIGQKQLQMEFYSHTHRVSKKRVIVSVWVFDIFYTLAE